MTLTEAAQLVGLHPETMRRLARAGKIATYRVNPTARHAVYRVTPAALAAFRTSSLPQRQQPVPPGSSLHTATPQERARAFRIWAQSHGSNRSVILNDRREDLYQDRD